MADRFRKVIPIKISFVDGEAPTSSKLNSLSNQIRSGLGLIEKAIGDVWNQSGDEILNGYPLQIPNLARVLGELKYLNPITHYLKYTFKFRDHIGQKFQGKSEAYLTFVPSDTPVEVNGLSTLTTLVSREDLVTDPTKYWVDTNTGKIRIGTAFTTEIIEYTVDLDQSNVQHYSQVLPSVIPDPRQDAFTSVRISQDAGSFYLHLPPRRPLTLTGTDFESSAIRPERYPGLTDIGISDVEETNEASVVVGGGAGQAGHTTRLYWQKSSVDALNDEHYRYSLPKEFKEYLEGVPVAGTELPQGYLYLFDLTSNTIIEDVRFYVSDGTHTGKKWVLKVSSDTFDFLTVKTDTEAEGDYNSNLILIAPGASVTRSIWQLASAFYSHKHDKSVNSDPAISHKSLKDTNPPKNLSVNEHYGRYPTYLQAWGGSKWNADDHLSLLSRAGSQSSIDRYRDEFNNAMLGHLVMANADISGSENYLDRTVPNHSFKIYFGDITAANIYGSGTDKITVSGFFDVYGQASFAGAVAVNAQLSVSGYCMPMEDNTFDCGHPNYRWRDLYVGPASLNIIALATDPGAPGTYTASMSLDSTGLKIGHNSASRNISFQTSNTDRLKISPEGRLDVVDPRTITSFTGNLDQGLRIYGGTLNTHYTLLGFAGAQNKNIAQIGVRQEAAGSYFQVGTSNNYTTGITNTALTVDPTGYIGLNGTPADSGSPSSPNRFTSFGSSGNISIADDGVHLRFSRTGTNYIHATGAGGQFYFTVNGNTDTSASMILNSTGYLGVGGVAPTSQFMNYYASTLAPSLTWNAFAPANFRNENSELVLGLSNANPFPYFLQARTSSSTARDIALNPAGGSVGVGAAPSSVSKLHVQTNSSGATAYNHSTVVVENSTSTYLSILGGSSSGHYQGIKFGNSGDNDESEIAYTPFGNTLSFSTNAVNRFYLNGAAPYAEIIGATYDVLKVNNNTGGSGARISFYNGDFQAETGSDGASAFLRNPKTGAGNYAKLITGTYDKGFVVAANDTTPTYYFEGPNGLAGADYFYINKYNVTNSAWRFASSAYAWMAFDNSTGHVGIGNNWGGTVLPAYPLDISDSIDGYVVRINNFYVDTGSPESHGIAIEAGDTTGSNVIFIRFRDKNANNKGGIRCDSAAANPYFFLGSDARLKENIVDTSLNALEILNNLRWRSYNTKTNPETTIPIGLVAQEAQPVWSELVFEDSEVNKDLGIKPLQLAESKLLPVACKAIQEQQQEIDELKATIQSLLDRVKTLEGK
jgi:hypothetical protein